MSVDEDAAHLYMNFCEFCSIAGTCPLFRCANQMLDEEDSEIPDLIGSCSRVQNCIGILEEP